MTQNFVNFVCTHKSILLQLKIPTEKYTSNVFQRRQTLFGYNTLSRDKHFRHECHKVELSTNSIPVVNRLLDTFNFGPDQRQHDGKFIAYNNLLGSSGIRKLPSIRGVITEDVARLVNIDVGCSSSQIMSVPKFLCSEELLCHLLYSPLNQNVCN